MPNIKSAKKRVKISAKRHENNLVLKSRVKNSIKKIEKAVAKGVDKKELEQELKVALKNIDKACDSNIISKNKASRNKSRIMKMVNSK